MFIPPKSDIGMKELFYNATVRKYFISDMLDIPATQIRSVRLRNTFLRRLRHQKQGILDVCIELNDESKINIEIQVRIYKYWDRRQLFYLAKMYTEDLMVGEDYSRLKRCVAISLLDFNLTDRPQYHSVYRLRDPEGHEFSDMLEVHIVELRKKLAGENPVNEWIRLFNVESMEELDMIRTNNPGIKEAIRELRTMSLGRALRYEYESYLKAKRDLRAMREYDREEGLAEGRAEGRAKGRAEGIAEGRAEGIALTKEVLRLSAQGMTASKIAKQLELSTDQVLDILSVLKE